MAGSRVPCGADVRDGRVEGRELAVEPGEAVLQELLEDGGVADGRRRRVGRLGNNFRPRSKGILENRLYRLHVVRTGKRDRRGGCHKIHSQMVQGRPYGLRYGTPARDRKARNRLCLSHVAPACGGESSRGDLFLDGDSPARILGTWPDGRRNDPVGFVRGHGREI